MLYSITLLLQCQQIKTAIHPSPRQLKIEIHHPAPHKVKMSANGFDREVEAIHIKLKAKIENRDRGILFKKCIDDTCILARYDKRK